MNDADACHCESCSFVDTIRAEPRKPRPAIFDIVGKGKVVGQVSGFIQPDGRITGPYTTP